jgi:hypothetical protein
VQKAFSNGWAVKAGQFKAPFLREELVSSAYQLAVERSLLNDTFTTKFAQGVQVEWEQESFRVQGFYGDGMRANRVNAVANAGTAGNYAGSYLEDFQTNDVNYAFAGRAEYKAAGAWKQFKDFNSYRGDEFGLLFGLGAMAQSLRPTATSTLTAHSMWGITGDVTATSAAGTCLPTASRDKSTRPATTRCATASTEDSLMQWGFLVQGGVFVTDDIELFGRYEYGDLDTDQFRTVCEQSGCADSRYDSIVTSA